MIHCNNRHNWDTATLNGGRGYKTTKITLIWPSLHHLMWLYLSKHDFTLVERDIFPFAALQKRVCKRPNSDHSRVSAMVEKTIIPNSWRSGSRSKATTPTARRSST